MDRCSTNLDTDWPHNKRNRHEEIIKKIRWSRDNEHGISLTEWVSTYLSTHSPMMPATPAVAAQTHNNNNIASIVMYPLTRQSPYDEEGHGE